MFQLFGAFSSTVKQGFIFCWDVYYLGIFFLSVRQGLKQLKSGLGPDSLKAKVTLYYFDFKKLCAWYKIIHLEVLLYGFSRSQRLTFTPLWIRVQKLLMSCHKRLDKLYLFYVMEDV